MRSGFARRLAALVNRAPAAPDPAREADRLAEMRRVVLARLNGVRERLLASAGIGPPIDPRERSLAECVALGIALPLTEDEARHRFGKDAAARALWERWQQITAAHLGTDVGESRAATTDPPSGPPRDA